MQITDKRSYVRFYDFENLLCMAMCAIMAGEDSFTGIADYVETNKAIFEQYFNLTEYTPRHDTFNRLFDALDTEAFHEWFVNFTSLIAQHCAAQSQANTDHLAIDGKTIRNSGYEKPFHIVHAWCSRHRLLLCQQRVDEKSNEITAIPILLDMLDLKGVTITIDAMGCQREICQKIITKEGDYVIALKDNQPTLYQDVQDYFTVIDDFTYATFEHWDKGHGRLEKRTCTVTDDIAWLQLEHKWPGLKSIVRVDSWVKTKKKETSMTRYFLSSLPPDASKHLEIIRNHWGVEGTLHWVLDCTFNEDKSCVRNENAALNLSTARKLALNVLMAHKDEKTSLRSLQRKCWNPLNAFKFLDKFEYA